MNSKLSAGWAVVLLMAVVLTGCASGKRSFSTGIDAMQDQQYDLAVAELTRALKTDPGNAEYMARLAAAREKSAWEHLQKGRSLRKEGKFVEAASELRLAAAMNPSLDVASMEFRAVQKLIEARELAVEAQNNLQARRLEKAEMLARDALKIDPDSELAARVMEQLKRHEKMKLGGYELDVDSKKPVTLKFKDADLKEVFKILNRLSGINFIFDEDLRNEKVTLLLEDATFAQALELLMKMNNLGSRVLNPKTVIIYSNTKDKQKQYEDQIIQTFYLSSIDAKKAVNMLRTMLQLRKIYVHEELNAIVVRDRPDVIELVAQILANADLGDSEVVFDLELIEVSHGDLMRLGIEPSSYGFSVVGVKNGDQVASSIPTSGIGNLIDTTTGVEAFFTLPTATFELSKTLTDTVILATPKIRVKNREKAKVHVGTREPSVTSTVSGENVSTNVQYIDVGVKVDVEPVIQLDNTVQTKLRLEVSSVSDRETVGGASNPTTVFTISTTNAETALILKDGERTIIGGLIRNSDNKSRRTIPVLGDIPLLGALFTKHDFDEGKREILLSVTPHIVKKIDVPDQDQSRIWSGGEEELKAGPNFAAFAERPVRGDSTESPSRQPAGAQEGQPAEQPNDGSVSDMQPGQELTSVEAETEPVMPERTEGAETEPVEPAPVPTQAESPVDPAQLDPGAAQALVPESAGAEEEQVAEVEVPPAAIKAPTPSAKLFPSGPELVDVGEEFTVELQVAEIEALYSAPLFVNYDPALLEFVRAEEADFLRRPGQSTVFTSSPNRSRGELIIGNKQGTGGEGASGSGTLARIVFQAKQSGSVTIRPNRINFRDPTGMRIPVHVEQFEVEIR